MKVILHHAYSEEIRPVRCEVCRDADAVRIVTVSLRFIGMPTAKELKIPCCAKDTNELMGKISAAIDTQDAEWEERRRQQEMEEG